MSGHDHEAGHEPIDLNKLREQLEREETEAITAASAVSNPVSAEGSKEGQEENDMEAAVEVSATLDEPKEEPAKDERLVKMGMQTALAIGIHNFPEGLATFVATLDDPRVGAGLAVAIAIHNIPEVCACSQRE